MLRPSSATAAFHILLHLLFLVLFFWAFHYYEERMLSYDAAFYSFKMIHYGQPDIEHNRYSAVFSQAIPLLALKAGVSLKTFLQLYSASFILVYYIVFLICLYLYRNLAAGLAILLALSLCVRETFYSPVSEFQQGMIFVILHWCILSSFGTGSTTKNRLNHIANATVTALVALFHPLLLTGMAFVGAYELIQRKTLYQKDIAISFLVTAFCFVLRLTVFPADAYESSKIPSLREFTELVPEFFRLPSTRYFLEFAAESYKTALALLGGTFIVLLLRRNFFAGVFCLLSAAGYAALVCLIYSRGESSLMYENYFILLGLIIGLPFAVEATGGRPRLVNLGLAALVLCISFYSVWKEHNRYSQRVAYIDRLCRYGRTFHDTRKFIVREESMPRDIVSIDWAFAFETLLHSSLRGPDSAVTVYAGENMEELEKLNRNPDLFLGADFALTGFRISTLNRNYFRLSPSRYLTLNTPQDSAVHPQYFHADSLSIEPLDSVATVFYYKTATVPVRIRNLSQRVLPSGISATPYPLYLSYHLYDANNQLIVPDGRRTPLEVDLLPGKEYLQGLIIDVPLRGRYRLEIDMLAEHRKWLGINRSCGLIVR